MALGQPPTGDIPVDILKLTVDAYLITIIKIINQIINYNNCKVINSYLKAADVSPIF